MTLRIRAISVLALAGALMCAQGLAASPVSAHEVTGSVNVSASASTSRPKPPAPIKEQLKERMETIRDAKRPQATSTATSTLRMRIEEKLAAHTQGIMAKLEEKKRQVLSKFGVDALNQFKKVDNRLTEALGRLTDISTRIDTRIAKLKSQNIDMTTAESLNTAAKTKLTDAQTKIQAITIPVLPTAASSTKEQINASLKTTREQVKAAEGAIQAAREALRKVVAEIKRKGGDKADSDIELNATTSASLTL
jgi:hypothetical protein